MERGWVPFLTPGAHDIRTAHDPEGTGRWGVFSFSREDEALLRNQLQTPMVLAGMTVDVPSRIEWWPVLLRGTFDERRANDATTTGLQAYSGPGAVFAVNWNQRRAYYWTQPRR